MNKITHNWLKLKERPVAYNLALIACVIFSAAIIAHILMHVGTRHSAHRTVPDFSGMRLEQARETANDHGLNLQINDSLFIPAYEGGIILDQLPEGGVEVKPGRTIYIIINAFGQKMVPVPYVADRSLRQAKNMLEIAGLEIEELVYRSDMATNYVLDQYYNKRQIKPSTRIEAEMGSGVVLHIGVQGGYGTTVVPLLIGVPLKQAKSRLWESGLNVGKINFDEGINLLNQKDARVYLQSSAAERSAPLGGRVDLHLTLDQTKVSAQASTAEKQAQQAAKERLAAEKLRADSLAIEAAEGAASTSNDTNSFFD